MVIMVVCYKIVDGFALIPTIKVLEKHDEDHDFGFGINNKLAWFKYLSKKYSHLSEDRNGIPRAFCVYNWGGHKRINFFPGSDKKTGKPLNLAKYGRLLDKSEHKWYLKKC